jgi:integrase
MPRARSPENKGLPARWRLVHGAYYYQVPQGMEAHWDGKKTFRLGSTLSEAYLTWGQRVGAIDKANTVAQLLDRYALEVIPKKKRLTQVENTRAVGRLRAVFGALPLTGIRPQLVYQYVDKSKSKIQARKEVRTFSHVFTKAVEWGYIDSHPFKGEIRLHGEKPRDRYIEDWELLECLKLDSKRKKGSVGMIQAYLRIKLLTGVRRGDLLRLTVDCLKDDGIHLKPRKTDTTTGKRMIFDWSDELREAVEGAKKARPVDISPWLFCNRKGECYFDEEKETASGWDSMWQRFIARVLKETKVKESFTEHDMRAKCASDAETLEHAQRLLAHADSKITNRVYRRKPERVKPLR